jgi:hypothetical protein
VVFYLALVDERRLDCRERLVSAPLREGVDVEPMLVAEFGVEVVEVVWFGLLALDGYVEDAAGTPSRVRSAVDRLLGFREASASFVHSAPASIYATSRAIFPSLTRGIPPYRPRR